MLIKIPENSTILFTCQGIIFPWYPPWCNITFSPILYSSFYGAKVCTINHFIYVFVNLSFSCADEPACKVFCCSEESVCPCHDSCHSSWGQLFSSSLPLGVFLSSSIISHSSLSSFLQPSLTPCLFWYHHYFWCQCYLFSLTKVCNVKFSELFIRPYMNTCIYYSGLLIYLMLEPRTCFIIQ